MAADSSADRARDTTASPEGLRYAGVLGLILACSIILVVRYMNAFDGYMSDDAFISFRYARNLADGNGLVWNLGQRVEGYTNFGWVLALAALKKIGVSPVDSSRALGLASSVATLALLPLLASQLQVRWSARWWVIVAGASAALALSPAFSIWTFAGLETPAQAFLVTLGVTLHLIEERTSRLPSWSSIAFLAAALVRPDSVVFWLATGAFKLGRVLLYNRKPAALYGLTLWTLIFLIPFGSYWLWRWHYYGFLFPNTVYLKTDGSIRVLERGWDYTREFLAGYWFWLLVPSVICIFREIRQAYRPATHMLAVLIIWLAYVSYSGGDWMPYYRFLVPVLPLAYVLMLHGALETIDVLTHRTGARGLIVRAAATIFVGIVVLSSARAYDRAVGGQGLAGDLPGAVAYQEHQAIGLWLHDHAPEEAAMANIAAGIVPYFSQLETIDMLGVNDEHIAHINRPLGNGPSGHEKQDGTYVVDRRPEIIWLGLGIEPLPRESVADYQPPTEPSPFPITTTVTRNPETWANYYPVAIELRGGWLNLLVRNDIELRP